MNTGKFAKSSALLALGMICASVIMLAQNSIAAATATATHATAPVQYIDAPVVTELPTVVVTGKRLTPAEKLKYRQLLKASSATLV
jgi:hypothetical protein